MEKEAFSILRSLEHFRQLLFGSRVNIFTDNANILFEKQNNSKRILRWRYLLNEYDFSLHHIKGTSNDAADFLSRIYSFIPAEQSEDIVYDFKQIARWQKLYLQEITKLSVKTHLFKDNKIHLDKTDRIIIPNKFAREFLIRYHEMLGHPGSQRFYHTFKNYIYISNYFRTIQKYTNQCIYCQLNKPFNNQKQTTSKFFKASNYLETICSDIVGPFSSKNFNSYSGPKFYLVTFVDVYSRGLKVYKLNEITGKTISDCLIQFIKEFGKPKRLHCDNGSQYTSSKFQKLCKSYNIKQTFSPRNSPQSNGIAEKVNVIIKNIIRIYRDYDIDFIISRIHNTNHIFHTSINNSPNEVISKRSIFDPFRKDISSRVENDLAKINNKKVKGSNEKAVQSTVSKFNISDLVIVKTFNKD